MLLDLSNCNLKNLEDCDIILEKLIELNSDYTSITYLNVSNNFIKSIKGLRAFENLKVLNISNNQLKSLEDDYIPSSTEKIIADHNYLTDICFKGIKKKREGGRTTEEEEEEKEKDEDEEEEKGEDYDEQNKKEKDDMKKEKEIEKKNNVNNLLSSSNDSLNSSFYNTFNNNLLSEKSSYTNKNLPLNRLTYLDVSYNNIKKLITFEKYLHIMNKKKKNKNNCYLDDVNIKNYISNKTEQDVMILFFNSLETLYLRGNKLTNLKGLSIFKNLKVLDLRSNLINHPVQLFYILDNKNWLKQYQEKKIKKESTSYYSYFVNVLKKYKNFKNLQNLFLQGNKNALKPKYLFMSVFNVLKNISSKNKLTIDVINGNESSSHIKNYNLQKKYSNDEIEKKENPFDSIIFNSNELNEDTENNNIELYLNKIQNKQRNNEKVEYENKYKDNDKKKKKIKKE